MPEAQYKVKIRELEKAEVLIDKGNGKKIIPPCFTCHGGNGQGEKQDIPALAGQQVECFVNILFTLKNTSPKHTACCDERCFKALK